MGPLKKVVITGLVALILGGCIKEIKKESIIPSKYKVVSLARVYEIDINDDGIPDVRYIFEEDNLERKEMKITVDRLPKKKPNKMSKDLNGDGNVDINDLWVIINEWLMNCIQF